MTTSHAEVVETVDGLSFDQAPLLVLDRLRSYLDTKGIGSGPISWSRIGEGQSNITYRIVRGDAVVVLRRGPRPPVARSTHDMIREANILQALRPENVPVPDVVATCDDDEVLGVPFYLMNWLEGWVITDEVPAQLDTDAQRRATSEAMVRALAHLHSIDITTPALAALGRPDGYLRRQITRLATLWDTNSSRELPLVTTLADWLERNLPMTQVTSVVHGDYRLGNVMFEPACPAKPLAILDWEMATLGDPLADLGYLVSTYTEAGSHWNPLHMSPVTALPGYHTRAQLVDEYASITGADVSALDWYRVLALWKAAVFCEAIYVRWLRGERPGDLFGPRLEAGVPGLLAEASLLAT